MHAYGTNCSTEKSSIRCERPRSSSRVGGGTTTLRPHASLGYKPPAPEVFVPVLRRVAGCATPTSSAGHASTRLSSQLTFQLDHSMEKKKKKTSGGQFWTPIPPLRGSKLHAE